MYTSAGIARRYLFSKKKFSAVGVITWLSVTGVAVATAAALCVLSVFNGFRTVMSEKLSLLAPEVIISPEQGKTFAASDSLMQALRQVRGVICASEVMEDHALAFYNGQEMPVRIRGVVPADFQKYSAIQRILSSYREGVLLRPGEAIKDIAEASHQENSPETAGEEEGFSEEDILAEELAHDTAANVVICAGIAARLGVAQQDMSSQIILFAPRRVGTINPANPAASFEQVSGEIVGIYQSMQADYDKDLLITDITTARSLLQHEADAVSDIYIYTAPGEDDVIVARRVQELLPSGLKAYNSIEQQSEQFRMVAIEKWITFLLLAFILIIASFNMISSLAMLVIDKQHNLDTLRALGASRGQIGAIFRWVSALVVGIGVISGLILGALLCLLQKYTGFIKLNGDPSMLIIDAYPVELQPMDFVAVALVTLLIGVVCAAITSRFARSRLTS